MLRIKQWIMAARPKTLTAAVVPIVAATALAWSETGNFSGKVLALTLIAATLIQIGTNLVNDAVDFKKGADTETRIGPQRVTQAGFFSAKQVLAMGTFVFGLAIIVGIPLVQLGGWPIVVVGLVSVIMGYAYTAGPFPLAYLGLGDLFVVLFFGLIAVGGVFYLHTLFLSPSFVIAGLQVGFLSTVLIAINNLRDRNQDVKVQKRTMAVRFGVQFARYEIAFLSFCPFLLGLFWIQSGRPWATVLPLVSLPFAVWLNKMIFVTDPSPAYNKFLGKAAALHLIFGSCLALGFIL